MVLENARQAMQDKMSAMQLRLETTQFNLNSIEQNQQYSTQAQNMVPVFPAGVIMHWEKEPVSYAFLRRTDRFFIFPKRFFRACRLT